jgi:hypothetical protein
MISKLTAKFVENIAEKGRYHDGNGLMLFVDVLPKYAVQFRQKKRSLMTGDKSEFLGLPRLAHGSGSAR